jgi:hypothetical protein
MRPTLLSTVRVLALACSVVTGVVSTGCGNSAYHRAGKDLPASIDSRLTTRIREARASGDKLAQALEIREAGSPSVMRQVDDTSWDFSRRVASVQDVLNKLPDADLQAQQVLVKLQRADETAAVAVKAEEASREQASTAALEALHEAIGAAGLFLATRDPDHESVRAGALPKK